MLETIYLILLFSTTISLLLMISILFFTIKKAKKTVQRRIEVSTSATASEIDSDEEEDDQYNELQIKHIRSELEEKYSFISEEYRDNHVEEQIVQTRRSSHSSRRSRSNSQAAVVTMLSLMGGRRRTAEPGHEDYEVNNALNMFEGRGEKERSNSWPHAANRIRNRNSRLWSLQNIKE